MRWLKLLIVLPVTIFYSCENDSDFTPVDWELKIPIIKSYIDETNTDSLINTVRVLSGEDSVIVGGRKTIIKHRISSLGNDLAADYIKERLNNYNLNLTDQKYSEGGRNIIATQTGALNPEAIYIICAHYDAVPEYAADDNASGVAAVIETARILSEMNFEHTIIYALWDEEEIGLVGSKFYAQEAGREGVNILGVVNMDMLGYDSNNDMLFDIHANENPVSIAIKDSLISIVSTYNIGLVPNVIDPGTTRSDHSSFWNESYGAILFGESFFGGDYNPEYHAPTDRIDIFNIPYFTELAKLSVGITASLANPN